ncbi:MAG: response regulator transcription factor [Desulfobacterales bacterium]|nr:response regulator transcription factor [Desulfobacterales bacterium]
MAKSTPPTQVHIVGPLMFQNKLMAWYLEEKTGLACSCLKELDMASLSDRNGQQIDLVLLDCLGSDYSNLWSTIRPLFDADMKRIYVAIFNMGAGQPFGNDLVKRGVRGVFYDDDPLPNLAKGVPAILEGELWFSRKDLMKCILDSDSDSKLAMELKAQLTAREREILLLIASGINNSQIAENLNISRNTVKTHLYNIYNKINVPNRLQAALWAAKHL